VIQIRLLVDFREPIGSQTVSPLDASHNGHRRALALGVLRRRASDSESGIATEVDNGTTATDTSTSDGDSSGPAGDCTRPWFDDDLEWADVDAAITDGPWASRDGDVSISENYGGGSSASAGEILPGRRTTTGGGETFNRFRSAEIGIEPDGGLDYPLGWSAAGGFGMAGTQDGGEISLFGNSVASDDAIHFGYPYAMPRGEWHAFELELRLGATGGTDGENFGADPLASSCTRRRLVHAWVAKTNRAS
jgi:hypothetical protein